MQLDGGEQIARDVARRLCAEVAAEQHARWWSAGAWRCWACRTMSRGETALMRYASRPDNRGCRNVTVRYEEAGRPPR